MGRTKHRREPRRNGVFGRSIIHPLLWRWYVLEGACVVGARQLALRQHVFLPQERGFQPDLVRGPGTSDRQLHFARQGHLDEARYGEQRWWPFCPLYRTFSSVWSAVSDLSKWKLLSPWRAHRFETKLRFAVLKKCGSFGVAITRASITESTVPFIDLAYHLIYWCRFNSADQKF